MRRSDSQLCRSEKRPANKIQVLLPTMQITQLEASRIKTKTKTIKAGRVANKTMQIRNGKIRKLVARVLVAKREARTKKVMMTITKIMVKP